MKKKMRALTSLTLAGLLTASMASPALADAASGTGTHEIYSYNWEVECRDTTGMAWISASPAQIAVTAYAQNDLYYRLDGLVGKSETASNTSFSSAIVFADNILYEEETDRHFVSEITKTTGWFDVGQERVVLGVNDYPG